MAQTTHLVSFGPVLIIINFPVAYYNCKCLKNDPPTRIVVRVGRCHYGRVVVVVVVVVERVGM